MIQTKSLRERLLLITKNLDVIFNAYFTSTYGAEEGSWDEDKRDPIPSPLVQQLLQSCPGVRALMLLAGLQKPRRSLLILQLRMPRYSTWDSNSNMEAAIIGYHALCL
jgi:hypothetical protein